MLLIPRILLHLHMNQQTHSKNTIKYSHKNALRNKCQLLHFWHRSANLKVSTWTNKHKDQHGLAC
jgi:hypothetical protein